MSQLNELYVRFMIWLGAAPPEGYEQLFSSTKSSQTSNSSLMRRLVGCLTSSIVLAVIVIVGFAWGIRTVRLTSLKLPPSPSFPLILKWQVDLEGTTKWEPTYQDGLVLLPIRHNLFSSHWYALDPFTGRIIWSTSSGQHSILICLNSEYLVASNTGTKVTPNGASALVLKTETGDLAWQRNDTLIISCSDNLILRRGNRGQIGAITKATGQEVWGDTKPSKGFSGLRHVLYNSETDQFFIRETTQPWDYYFIDANSGQLNHFIEKTEIIPNASSQHELNSSMLLINDQQIFMSIWPDTGNRLVAILDSKSGEVLHKEDRYGAFHPQIIIEHRIYASSQFGIIALDRDSFDIKWRYPHPEGSPQGARSSLVSLDGIGYVIYSDMTLRAIDLETGQELGYWQPESIELMMGGKAGLATSKDMLYATFGDGKVYAFVP